MKEGWALTTLGNSCDIVNGGTPKTGVTDYWGGGHLWITPAEMGKRQSPYVDETARTLTKLGLQDSSARLLPPLSVILSSRAPIGHLVINTKEMATNQGCKGLVPNKHLDHKFLFYYLSSIVNLLNDFGTGTTFKEISGTRLKEVPLPLPPLPEQKRVVAILDEMFEGIGTATAHAEKNLANARDLFGNYLNSTFAQRDDGWIERPLGECFRLKSGDGLTSKAMIDGPFPVFGGNGVAGMHSEFNLSGDNVIIGRVGALCGNARYVNENVWLTDNAFKVVDYSQEFDCSFLTILLNHLNLRSLARQSAQPVISNSSLKDLLLVFPEPVAEQRRIAANIQKVSSETRRLEETYRQKITSLVELKQAILQKAFAGKLSGRPAEAVQEAAE